MFTKKAKEITEKLITSSERDFFRRIIRECVDRATALTSIKIDIEINYYRVGIINVKLTRYIYDDDTTIRTRVYNFRDLAHLIVEKDGFIEKIKEDFVEVRSNRQHI